MVHPWHLNNPFSRLIDALARRSPWKGHSTATHPVPFPGVFQSENQNLINRSISLTPPDELAGAAGNRP